MEKDIDVSMSFKDSLTSFKFLSELYQLDAPKAVLMTEYPSSNSNETQFQNKTKYIIHDPYPAPPIGLLKTLGPHHLMYGWGNKIPVTSEVEPPRKLIDHWMKIFGEAGRPNWQAIGNHQTYITSFPFEAIQASQQVIEPDALYHMHSKEAIAEISCAQAAVYERVKFPCIIKLSHGYAGLGNFFVHNEADLKKAQIQISEQWPDAPLVINQMLSDIVGDYGVQFYLNKQGEMTWIGFTQQVFNDSGKWSGGVFNADIQDEFYDEFLKIAEPVAAYLHGNGYFGVVGIDILQNKQNEFFLVDLNPRLTGISPFLIASRLFIAEGYSHGIYAASVELHGNLSDILARIEAVVDSRVLILAAYQAPNAPTTKCHISISAKTLSDCEKQLSNLRHLTEQPKATYE